MVAQFNPQTVIAPEAQHGPSRTVTSPEILPLPRPRLLPTARIAKTCVRTQNSAILTGAPVNKLEDCDGERKVKRTARNIKSEQENLPQKAERKEDLHKKTRI